MIPKNTILKTQNYCLRFPSDTDFDFIFSATRYPGFNDGMLWDPPKDKSELIQPLERAIKAWEEGRAYGFTIESRKNATRLGKTSIRKTEEETVWNIGFWIHPEQQNKGIMTEAVGALLEFGFHVLNASKITAQYAIWNKGSEKVLLNNGFKFVKHLEKGFFKNNKWVAENELCITKEAYTQEIMDIGPSDFTKRLVGNKNTIYEDEQLVILLDIDPISTGHVLICPKKHYTDFHLMPDSLISAMMSKAKDYIQVLQKIFPNKGYSMMLNAGHFNDLKHCHLHIFPRNSKEEFSWTYDEGLLTEDSKRFEVLKKLLEGHI